MSGFRWAALLAACCFTVPAAAQTPPPVAIPASDFGPVWTGFYVGAAFGAGGAVNKLGTSGPAPTAVDSGGSGVLGSVYGGVDYQITQRGLIGLLGELSYSGFMGSASAQLPAFASNLNLNTGLGWAVLARAGVLASPTTLLYLAGGYAGQNIQASGFGTIGGSTASFSSTQTLNGWTIGPGFETMLGRNWSGKLEYRYSQFGGTTLAGTNIGLNSPSNHAVRAGITYRFGGLGAIESHEQAPPAPTRVNWTGLYGGVAAGGGLGVGRVDAAAGGGSAGFDGGGQGLLGGVFAGGDYQFAPNALVGVMGDFTWTGIQSTLNVAPPGANAFVSAEQNRQWSVMGRLGYLPVPSTLIYAAAGYSQLNVHASANASLLGGVGLSAMRDTSFSGFTVGPGIETVITGGWTTRLEYRYSQFEEKEIATGAYYQPSNHTIRVGLSYKFDVGSGTGQAD